MYLLSSVCFVFNDKLYFDDQFIQCHIGRIIKACDISVKIMKQNHQMLMILLYSLV